MPLWATPLYFTDMQDVRQVLTFIGCLLEGLAFRLHANRIAHRDISDFNTVVSSYRLDRDMYQFQHDLPEFQRGDDVLYALTDYG
ncbi:hypothetical protein GSI_04008 [Ganoderma sinense ZZ0214-1]|uniref:Protein kinase domain-containing protein n=1 Tax=Ganoderma sinense ZZ0214-1 TaxID=1077348 RepID=A0A2G8SIK1_9APHY|nr:hypothetical protein GSI_04008 [Ganoderma sinense ZZ0214-1]